MFVCKRCKAKDARARMPTRCARCCFWGTMIDGRLLEVRKLYGRQRTGTDDVEYDVDEDGNPIDEDGNLLDLDDDEQEDDDDEDGDAPEYIKPVNLSRVSVKEFVRVKTGWPLFDETIGGGLIPGFIYLLGGDPGAGKSTLCLQIAHALQTKVRYVTAEEHATKIAARARRAKISPKYIDVVRTKDIESALNVRKAPKLIVLDSLQRLRIEGHLGANSPVEVMDLIEEFTRRTNCITIVLSRVNKQGKIAGKNDLDHDSDVTMQLMVPGRDAQHKNPDDPRRFLKIAKNREGPAPRLIECMMFKDGIKFDTATIPTSDPNTNKPTSRPITSANKSSNTPIANATVTNKPATANKPATNKPATRDHLDSRTLDKNAGNSSNRTDRTNGGRKTTNKPRSPKLGGASTRNHVNSESTKRRNTASKR